MIPDLNTLSEERPFLFTLHPFFTMPEIDMSKQSFVPFKDTLKHSEEMKHLPFPIFSNPYIENEIRGCVQHLVIDCHFRPPTIAQYMNGTVRYIAGFMQEYYPDVLSLADLDYEEAYNHYIEFLTDKGLELYYNTVKHVTEKMTLKAYEFKAPYLAGFATFYKYIRNIVFPDTQREYDKDIWDIRKLGIPYSTAVSRPRYTINFSRITQPWLRENVKAYQHFRIQVRTMSAVLDDMKALQYFSEYLESEHPEITSLQQLNREIAEGYLAFVTRKGLSAPAHNRRISGVRTFLLIGSMLDLGDFPEKPLIFYKDYHKVVHCLPKYFTDNELAQMNAHIGDLPLPIARIFFVLENCGMRVSDICSSEINPDGHYCLRKNTDEEYIFTYNAPKVHKLNTIPVSEVVGTVIESAIEDSRKAFGDNCKYIFARTENTPISVETFSNQMNKMSYQYGLVRDDGTPLRIKGHTFRGTIATQYANCGISMDVIRMMLGQQKLGVLRHYVTIHGDSMIDCMKPITEKQEWMIRNIGNIDVTETEPETIKEPSLLPLPNGRCAKSLESGICNHAYACYSCRMFRPSPECLNIYKKQLQEAENNIAIAELHGYERLIEINTDLRDHLMSIIERVTGAKRDG